MEWSKKSKVQNQIAHENTCTLYNSVNISDQGLENTDFLVSGL